MVIDIYRKFAYDEPKYLSLTYVDGNPTMTVKKGKILINNCHPLFDNLGMENTSSLPLCSNARSKHVRNSGEFDGKVQIALNYQKSLDLREQSYIDEETKTPDLENTKKPEFRI